VIKTIYPNIQEIYLEQNYSGDDNEDTWKTFENFFINMKLKTLCVSFNQCYNNRIINDESFLLQKITNYTENIKVNNDMYSYDAFNETIKYTDYTLKLYEIYDDLH
jgi:hypothetical protein